MSNKSDEVASNSVYGIGTLAANALPVMARFVISHDIINVITRPYDINIVL